jgi:hypothetical protein
MFNWYPCWYLELLEESNELEAVQEILDYVEGEWD